MGSWVDTAPLELIQTWDRLPENTDCDQQCTGSALVRHSYSSLSPPSTTLSPSSWTKTFWQLCEVLQWSWLCDCEHDFSTDKNLQCHCKLINKNEKSWIFYLHCQNCRSVWNWDNNGCKVLSRVSGYHDECAGVWWMFLWCLILVNSCRSSHSWIIHDQHFSSRY